MNEWMRPQSLIRLRKEYPNWDYFQERKIISCGDPSYWYANMVGQTIRVKVFGTFSCWDEQGRWISFYDIGVPVRQLKSESIVKKIIKAIGY